jgi:hypothetical protein
MQRTRDRSARIRAGKTPYLLLGGLAGLALVALGTPARAEGFAQPPDDPVIAEGQSPPRDRSDYNDNYERYYTPQSTVRLMTGPALRVSRESPDGGLFAAVDIGERAAGLRLSGSWVRVGSARGLSQYTGELWLDFGSGKRLHPILGAGAGVARENQKDATSGALESHTLGIGLLRGSLQYSLPVRDTDARAALDVIGSVPAIRGSSSVDSSPWLLVVASVGVGF